MSLFTAPVVKWNFGDQIDPTDKWSKTYTAREGRRPATAATSGMNPCSSDVPKPPSSPTKRFPRPITDSFGGGNLGTQMLGKRVSAHIASATVQQPSSPPKHANTLNYPPEAGVLPIPNSASLSKVYGSVLQPKESLTTH